MLELLTKLQTKGSSFPDNQPEYANTQQRCPVCSYTSRKHADPDCWRCGGARRIPDTGAQKQDRTGYVDQGFTPSNVAILLAGIPSHKVDAALVFVNRSRPAADRLMEHMVKSVISIQAHNWKLKENVAAQRVAGLASACAFELGIYPKKIPMPIACALLDIKKTQWKDVWRERHEINVQRLVEWVDEVDHGMRVNHYGKEESA